MLARGRCYTHAHAHMQEIPPRTYANTYNQHAQTNTRIHKTHTYAYEGM